MYKQVKVQTMKIIDLVHIVRAEGEEPNEVLHNNTQRKEMNKVILVLIVMLSTGCATEIPYNAPHTNLVNVDYPELGQEHTAYIGDELVGKGIKYEQDVLHINRRINVTIMMSPIVIPAGNYVKLGSDNTTDYYSTGGQAGVCAVYGTTRNCQFAALSVKKQANSELCVVYELGGEGCVNGNFTRTTQLVEKTDSFKQTLLYSGKVGNKITLSYREFNNQYARQAFSNSAEYDLSESKIVGYKGARIEVLKADNSSITYRVIKNFR